MSNQANVGSSIYPQFNDTSSRQTTPRAVQYKAPVVTYSSNVSSNANPIYNVSNQKNENAQPILKKTDGNRQTTPGKNNKYIKFLKDQNVLLKQQMDQMRQETPTEVNSRSIGNVSSIRSPSQIPTPISAPPSRNTNPTVEQIRYDQLLLKYQNLENEMNRKKQESEDQQAEKLSQIESLLCEKQQFLEEKDRLNQEIIRLTNLVDETKKEAEKKAKVNLADREYELKSEIEKVEKENKRMKKENEKYAADIKEFKTKLEDIKSKSIEMQKQNEALQTQNESLSKEIEELKAQNQQNANDENSKLQLPGSSQIQGQTRSVENENHLLKKKTQEIIQLEAKLNKYRARLRDIVSQNDNNNVAVSKLNLELKQLNKTIEGKERQITNLLSKQDQMVSEKEESLSLYQKAINESNNLRMRIATLESELEDKNQQLDVFNNKKNKTKKLKNRIENLEQENARLASKNKELEVRISVLDYKMPNLANINSMNKNNLNLNSSNSVDRYLAMEMRQNQLPPRDNQPPLTPTNQGNLKGQSKPLSDSALALLAEKIDSLTSKFGEDNEIKAKQIDELTSKISSLSETHKSLSKQVKDLRSQIHKPESDALQQPEQQVSDHSSHHESQPQQQEQQQADHDSYSGSQKQQQEINAPKPTNTKTKSPSKKKEKPKLDSSNDDLDDEEEDDDMDLDLNSSLNDDDLDDEEEDDLDVDDDSSDSDI